MIKKVIIAGYYGFQNVGDEAVLQSMLNDLRQTNIEFDFTVISNNPDETSKKYMVDSIHWNDYQLVTSVVKESDLLIVGGGGLFNSYLDYEADKLLLGGHQLFSVFIFGLPILANLLNTKSMIFGVGASHINSEDAKLHILKAVEFSEITTVRDYGSKDILIALGCESDKITVTADPAFRLDNVDANTVYSVLQKENIVFQDRPIIGVVVRNWEFYGDNHITEEAIYFSLKKILEHEKFTILFIPFDDGKDVGDMSFDTSMINRLIRKLGNSPYIHAIRGFYTSDIYSSIISLCDVTIAMRLHSVIFSLKNHVPCIGLVYDQKVKNILDMAELGELAIDIKDITSESILKKLSHIIANKRQYTEQIVNKSTELKDKAFNNIQQVISILENRPKKESKENDRFIENLSYNLMINANKHLENSRKSDLILQKNKQYLRTLIDQANYSLACMLTESLLEIYSDDPDLNYFKAFCLQSLGVKDQVINYYEKALEYGYDKFWVYYNRGIYYFNNEEYQSAQKELDTAKKINPDHEGVILILDKLSELYDD